MVNSALYYPSFINKVCDVTKTRKPSATKAAADVFAPKAAATKAQPPYLAMLMKEDRAELSHVEIRLAQGCDPNQPDEEGRTPIELAMKRQWIDAVMMLKKAGAVPPKFEGNEQADPNLPLKYETYRGTVYTNVKQKMESMSAFSYFVSECYGVDHIISALANGADVNLTGSRGSSPLEITQRYDNGREWPWLATQLVKLGAWRDPSKPDPDEIVNRSTGATRLLAVILEGRDYRAVERILKEGANPDKPDNLGLTPLAAALAVNWPQVEKLLVKHGAKEDVALPDPDQLVGDYSRENKVPLLTYAMRGGNINSNFFMALLNAGANPDFAAENGMTTAYTACVHKHMWHMEQLWNYGADFSLPSKDGATPVAIACYNNSIDVVKWLDGKVPDEQFTMAVGKNQDTPLHYAVHRADCAPLVAFLLAKGADPTIANKAGETPLKIAARTKGTGDAMKLLMEAAGSKKTDVDARDAKGRTALDAAISGQTLDPKMVRYLLDQGADVKLLNAGDTHDNPGLFSLVGRGWDDEGGVRKKAAMEILQMLVEKGVDLNVKATSQMGNAHEGDSLLYHAANNYSNDMVKYMIENGADVYSTSGYGKTIAHEYIARRNVQGMEMLLDMGFDPLKHWDFTEDFSSWQPSRYIGTALDHARIELMDTRNHGREKDGMPMVDLIEHRLHKKGIDTDKIPYPVMLAKTDYEHARALGKLQLEEKEKAEEALKTAPAKKPAMQP